MERRGSLRPDKLIPLVYAELRRLTHRYVWNERAGHSLQTSELINETTGKGCRPPIGMKIWCRSAPQMQGFGCEHRKYLIPFQGRTATAGGVDQRRKSTQLALRRSDDVLGNQTSDLV